LRRLVKRNRKQDDATRKALGARKRGPKPQAQKQQCKEGEKKLVCKIPFIVVKY